MKKALLLMMICAFAMACCLSGCSSEKPGILADAAKYTAGDAELTEPVEKIEIDWASGSVTVKADSGTTVRLSEKTSRSLPEDSRMHWRLEGTTLKIVFQVSGKLFSVDELFSSVGEKNLTVLVPEALNLTGIDVQSSSADVTVSGIKADSVSVETSSGEISSGCEAKDIQLESTSGAIALTTGSADSISAESTSGNISAAFQAAGSVGLKSTSGSISASGSSADRMHAKNTSGKITLSMDSAPKTCRAESTSGSVTLYLPENADFVAEVDTTSGEFESDFALVKNKDTYTCGKGGNELKLEATSGDVSILKK